MQWLMVTILHTMLHSSWDLEDLAGKPEEKRVKRRKEKEKRKNKVLVGFGSNLFDAGDYPYIILSQRLPNKRALRTVSRKQKEEAAFGMCLMLLA